ncbi:S-layer homology domain-containing protein [Calidifontibacillus oryziterrae]|uniref:S-layer homology domain-containing protein n=1 Tax=Calidifontibacillus oryziterrae TaxID=1191699 RepID=UPI0002E019FE|nr:S-layer homology domain-containing protein [Calidifontibacillus oryziterrae]
MKSTKLLSSSIAAALVTSIATPAVTQADSVSFKDLSSNSIYYNDVQYLVSKGIIGGFEDETFRPNEPLTREQAASMFVRALELDTPANFTSIIERYSDIKKDSWSASLLAAFINAGISEDESLAFGPKNPLTREVMATWLVNAFDFSEDGDDKVPFKDANQISSKDLPNVKILYQNKIIGGKTDGTFGPKDAVTRAQFTAFMRRALAKFEDGATEIEEKEETTQFEIVDTDVLNLKQVMLTTNRSISNEEQLTNPQHYTIEDENGNVIKIADVTLNQKEIVLTLEKALNSRTNAELVVAADVTGNEEEFDLYFSDNSAPEIESVTATGQNSYLITFSEPLDFGVGNGERLNDKDILDSFEVDGLNYMIDKITVLQHGQALHIELEVNLREGEHELEIIETKWFEDYAGHELETSSADFTMKIEKTAPKLLDVKNVQPNQVTLVFDKFIKMRYRGYIYHTTSSHYPSKATVQNGNELVLTFDSKDLITKSTDLILDSGAIEDLWGNKNSKLTKSIKIQDDKTPPAIENVQFIDSTVASSSYIKMKVTFSEAVKIDVAEDINRYELEDQQGNKIQIRNITFDNSSTDSNVATFTIDKYYGDVPSQRFTMNADELVDLMGNKSRELSYSFTASSEKPPGDFTGKMVLNDREDEVMILVDFGKKMANTGDFSVTQLEKYQLSVGSKTILLDDLHDVNGLDVSISTNQETQRVEILIEKTGKLVDAWDDFFDNLADAIDDEDLDDLELIVGRVADQNDNKTVNIVNEVKLSVQSEFDKDQVTAEAIDFDTIELEFDDELKDFDADDFVVFADRDNDRRFDSREELDAEMSMRTENGSSVITIKLEDDELDSDGRYRGDFVYVTTNKNVKTTNRFGQEVDFTNLRVEDGIVPKIETYRGTEQVYVQSVRNDSSKAIVSLKFTDDIDESTLTRLSFMIGNGKKFEIDSMFVEDGDKVCLVVNLGSNRVEDLVGEYVKQRAAISDENDNIITGLDLRINEERNSRTLD